MEKSEIIYSKAEIFFEFKERISLLLLKTIIMRGITWFCI